MFFLLFCRLDFLAARILPLSRVSSGSDREKVLVTTGQRIARTVTVMPPMSW
jgi:hypothetical protein